MKFKKYFISELIDEISMGPFGSNIKVECFVDKGIPVLNGSNLEGYELKEDSFRYVTEEKADSLNKANAYRGDIVITHRGTLGQIVFIPQTSKYDRYVISQSQFRVSTTFQKIEIEIPDIPSQKRIIAILQTIHDKIAINTKINENLAQQAQAIYRSMFVSTPYESDRIGVLSELIAVKYGKDHKKLNDGIYPVYGSGGIMRYVEKPIYEKESVLIPRKGSLNNVMYIDEPFWSVDTMFYTEMKIANVAKYVFHFLRSKDLASLNAGSAVPSMTTDILNSMEVSIPSTERLADFENLVAPLYRVMKDNVRQSNNLSLLRDTLLPKLMSGDIDVSEVKI